MTSEAVKKAARAAVLAAERRGDLFRPGRCSYCGRVALIEAHHVDYGRPLDVEWLCVKCHPDADAERRVHEQNDLLQVSAFHALKALEHRAIAERTREHAKKLMEVS